MENKYIITAFALALIAILGIATVSAYGFGHGMMNQDLTDEEKEALKEEREAVREAIESENYEAWESLMNDKVERLKSLINEEEFESRVQKHQEREEMREQFEDEGGRRANGMNKGQGKGLRNCNSLEDE